jgi:hypothetical protein
VVAISIGYDFAVEAETNARAELLKVNVTKLWRCFLTLTTDKVIM